jgi:hypothetical protein
MNASLNNEQLALLVEIAFGSSEPATARTLRELSRLRQLGLLSFDGGGRYELTAAGHARLEQARRLH